MPISILGRLPCRSEDGQKLGTNATVDFSHGAGPLPLRPRPPGRGRATVACAYNYGDGSRPRPSAREAGQRFLTAPERGVLGRSTREG